jgi:hypothetical protein
MVTGLEAFLSSRFLLVGITDQARAGIRVPRRRPGIQDGLKRTMGAPLLGKECRASSM